MTNHDELVVHLLEKGSFVCVMESDTKPLSCVAHFLGTIVVMGFLVCVQHVCTEGDGDHASQ